MSEGEIQAALRLRRGAKSSFTRAANALKSISQQNPHQDDLQDATDKVKESYEQVVFKHNEYCLLVDDAQFDIEEAWIAEVEEAYQQIRQTHLSRKSSGSTTPETETLSGSSSAEIEPVNEVQSENQGAVSAEPQPTPYRIEQSRMFKFERPELPRFRGEVKEYISFRNDFQKFIQPCVQEAGLILRSCLGPKPLAEVAGLGSDVQAIWEELDCIYGNPRMVSDVVLNDIERFKDIMPGDDNRLVEFVNLIRQSSHILEQVGRPEDINNNGMLAQIERKLPYGLKLEWAKYLEVRKIMNPTLKDINEWLATEKRMRIRTGASIRSAPRTKMLIPNKPVFAAGLTKRQLQCYICRREHRVADCPELVSSEVNVRYEKVRAVGLCTRCLTKGHATETCRSTRVCGVHGCQQAHHQLLHRPSGRTMAAVSDFSALSPVIKVKFKAANGRTISGNVLIDSGAGVSIIRTGFANALGLQGKRQNLNVSLVGGRTLRNQKSKLVKVTVSPLLGEGQHVVEAYELDQTASPVGNLDHDWLRKFPHLEDLHFSQEAGPIDLILGVQYSHLHAELEVRRGRPFEPIARRTVLGWYVIGPGKPRPGSVAASVNLVEKVDLDLFFGLESLGIRAPDCSCPRRALSTEDRAALHQWETTCEKKDGRYRIGLPWKESVEPLKDGYVEAKRRLRALEVQLKRSPLRREMYANAMEEYVEKGWAKPVPTNTSEESPAHYLPHFGVWREGHESTPLRVVFDSTQLNKQLLRGPDLLESLIEVLLRFRELPFAFTGDIKKMFLQIELPEDDRRVHRYLWGSAPDVYALQRVTFGDKSSPGMANFVMLRLAKDVEEDYPKASTTLRQDRYMDDIIHSCVSAQEAREQIQQLEAALAKGSFEIKKWNTSREILSCPKEDVKTCQVNTTSTLGLLWNRQKDELQVPVKERTLRKSFTKRSVLSVMAGIYDPLGLVTPVTITAKVELQELWKAGIEWDEPLSVQGNKRWIDIFNEISKLNEVSFLRCVNHSSVNQEVELHIFVDASALAYGAAVYVRTYHAGRFTSSLLTAKGRVAPLKQQSIPRLELMGAVIGSRLAKTVTEGLRVKPSRVILWCDSKIVLRWISSASSELKTFVGVRVAEIQSSWDSTHWRYVPSECNPADDITRGLSASELSGRWSSGPDFLMESEEKWPPIEEVNIVKDGEEYKKRRSVYSVSFVCVENFIDVRSFSSWTKLVRVTAYCLRFIKKLRLLSGARGSLLPDELREAEVFWIKEAQRTFHEQEKELANLSPFKEGGIIRVGGRLKHAPVSYDQIHPILLPYEHPISTLIMRHYHNVNHHSAERLLSDTRRRYWVTKGRALAKSIVHACVLCRKFRRSPHSTLMADLPAERLSLHEPVFFVTGVDLFGPFNLKLTRNTTQKAWGAIFCCATVRCVHLEIVDNLSTEAFMHALRRFAALHGWPSTIVSDNGTSFVGTERELRSLVQAGRQRLEDFAVLHQVRWKFITPLSPHQGGLYESLIKQVKAAIRKVIGSQRLTWNEMATVFAEAKCLVNGRPLGYTHSDPNEIQPLTPNHLILGRATAEIPQGPFVEAKDLRKRFLFVQALVANFWGRFLREYLPTLVRRNRWRTKNRQMSVGDVVLLVDPIAPRGRWLMGRVLRTFPGQDGLVRNVRVKTQGGELERSVQRCVLLLEAPLCETEES